MCLAGKFWAGLAQGRALVVAAFAFWAGSGVQAQDLTLTSRDGALAVSGNFTSYDGAFYRLTTPYGPLTIAADTVVCDGPACPDLTAPKSLIRLTGDAGAARALLPGLIAAFAQTRGYDLRLPESDTGPTVLLQPGTGIAVGEFQFTPRAPEAARSAMADASADLVVARFTPLDSPAQVLALDALVPIVSPENSMPHLTTAQLADALAGKVDNWAQLGGREMPLVLHGLDSGSDLAAALAARLGQVPAYAQTHADLAALAAAVAGDPWALAVTGLANAAAARVIALRDSCGFVLQPSALAVKSEDYPLTLPVYLLTPQRRLPVMAREFLEFVSLPAAQTAIAAAGFVARDFETVPLAQDGARLINAIKAAGSDALPNLQRLAADMDSADRTSITFRFEDGTDDLDLMGQNNLTDLAQRIAAGQFGASDLVLVGFTAGSGDADAEAAQTLAQGVLDALKPLAPDVPDVFWPSVDAYGAVLPMACDSTAAGQRLNRRVELWLRP
jgi:phosphate transport system substrate-binding protein